MAGSLEQRVEALERTLSAFLETGPAGVPDGQFWMLKGLKDRCPDGAVGLVGVIAADEGPVEWQYVAPASSVSQADWSLSASALAALGHPVRLALLQSIHLGMTTTAELVAMDSIGTTGQVHHHLKTLVAGGWLTSTGRGRYAIPATRVVPLLVTLLAATPS